MVVVCTEGILYYVGNSAENEGRRWWLLKVLIKYINTGFTHDRRLK